MKKQIIPIASIVIMGCASLVMGQKMTVKDSDNHVLMEVNDEGETGSITMPVGSAPTTVTNKLYNVNGTLYWSGNSLINSSGGWIDEGTKVRLTTLNDSVGIGIAVPNAKLHVDGMIQMTGFKLTTAPSGGYVLTSDASGVGTWQQPITSGGGLTLPYSGTTSSNNNAFQISTTGTGRAGDFSIININNNNTALVGYTTGLGRAGIFDINNSNNTQDAVVGHTNGLGSAGGFSIDNVNNNSPALSCGTNGNSDAVWGANTGTGRAGSFAIINSTNTQEAVMGHTNGLGTAGNFSIDNVNNNSPAIVGVTNGSSAAVLGVNNGTGRAGWFEINNTSNTQEAVVGHTNGLGSAGSFGIDNAQNTRSAVVGTTNGMGRAGDFSINNTSNTQQPLMAYTNGLGTAGNFSIDNVNNNSSAIVGVTNGSGAAVSGFNNGTGRAGWFQIDNTTNTQEAVIGHTHGLGRAGQFDIDNTNNNREAVVGSTVGLGRAGNFDINNASNNQEAVVGHTNGLGSAGLFVIDNTNNTNPGLNISITGTGPALWVHHNGGSSGNIAVFLSDGSNKIRFDKSGNGYFNGGTQVGGADLAEYFEIEGAVSLYEPGDALIISTQNDRRVEKSNAPYSTLVAGVYATKPGVLMTERSIDENHDGFIPVGVVGVIPTKVCTENGPIKRGDLLVTSSIPGCVMRGDDRDRMMGAVIGKALQNYNGTGIDLINVLVNVK